MKSQLEFCSTEAVEDHTTFLRYPAHKVLGVLSDSGDVRSAIKALKSADFTDDEIGVFCGQDGEKRIDFSGEEHGFWATFIRSIQNLSSERIYLEKYQNELHEGHFLLTVHAVETERKERAFEIIKSNNGHRLSYFGTWHMEGIPETKAEKDKTNSYGYRRELEIPFEETVVQIRETLKKEGFGILTEIDMKEKLKEKLDVDFRKYMILGACNPSLAHSALKEELDIGLLLPCNVIVYESEKGSVVAAIDAKKMLSVAGNPQLESTAETVNEKLRSVIENL